MSEELNEFIKADILAKLKTAEEKRTRLLLATGQMLTGNGDHNPALWKERPNE